MSAEFIKFNKSKNFDEAAKISSSSSDTLYFPPNESAIIHNGKVIGIKDTENDVSFNDTTGILSHKTSGATAGNYGQSSNSTPSHGGSFNVPYVTVNNTGHITNISSSKVTLPSLAHTHSDYATTSHSHTQYSTTMHTHDSVYPTSSYLSLLWAKVNRICTYLGI